MGTYDTAQRLRKEYPQGVDDDTLRGLALGSDAQLGAYKYFQQLLAQGMPEAEARKALCWWWGAEYDEPTTMAADRGTA